MKKKKVFQKMLMGALILSLGLLSTCQNKKVAPVSVCATGKTISQLINEDPNYSMMKAALQRASTVENVAGILSNSFSYSGFTVFVPTNAAFQAIGFNTEADFANADPTQLRDILKYHITVNYLPSLGSSYSSFEYAFPYSTLLGADENGLNGRSISISSSAKGYFINPNNPTFTLAELSGLSPSDKALLPFGITGRIQLNTSGIKACNGTILSVNQVLIPPPAIDLMLKAFASQSSTKKEFSTFLNNLQSSNLSVNSNDKYTIFAPNDDAFSRFSGYSSAQVVIITAYHILKGQKIYSNEIGRTTTIKGATVYGTIGANYTMLNGGVLNSTVNTQTVLTPSGTNKAVSIYTYPQLTLDITCSNGVIHTINTVLIPTLQ
jgi:uncharacterized surface protein with fasciclin (FAS1) repeats